MKARVVALVALAAAVALTSVAAAGAGAAKQRVAIVSKGVPNGSGFGMFVLTPLQAGVLKRDSGPESGVRNFLFHLQRGLLFVHSATLKGKRGKLVIQSWIDAATVVDAGRHRVATGTWKVTRGTGQYARVTGGGRSRYVYLERSDHWSSRNEGFLALPIP